MNVAAVGAWSADVTKPTGKLRKPKIVIGQTDHERLLNLAMAASERLADVADELMAELDRATIVPDERVGDDVVRMGSQARYCSEAGDTRTVTLVYPGNADISEGRISILTPIGVALIGLMAGSSINWKARDGRLHQMTVLSVVTPRIGQIAAAAPTAADQLGI